MNELSPTITFSFSIVGCKCDRVEFTEFATLNKIEIHFNGYEFTTTLNIDIKRESSIISIMATTFLAKLNDKVKIAELKATHDFKIIDFDKVVISTDAGLMIADGVLIQLFSISISSIRGMYAAKLADSLYNNAIFPVTDVSRLIPKKPSPIG